MIKTKVPYVDFGGQYKESREDLIEAVDRVLRRGDFVMGREVEAFESEFAKLCGVPYAIGVANGTDAIVLSLKALGVGPGDEVITVPNTFVATAGAIVQAGATPVFVDVNADFLIDSNQIDKVVTSRTKAIIPVHLTGRSANMDAVLIAAQKHGLKVIEDAAQSAGAKWDGQVTGSMGDLGCFSLHPLKNLNGVGDGGVITTKNETLAHQLRLVRNHGMINRDEVAFWGVNSRLDTIQASVLLLRLNELPQTIQRRREIAKLYDEELKGVVSIPVEGPKDFHSYHLYVIQSDRRDKLKEFLSEKGIDSKIHYPIPIHLQAAAKRLGYKLGSFPVCEKQTQEILSLPVHQYLNEGQIQYVIESVKEFFKN